MRLDHDIMELIGYCKVDAGQRQLFCSPQHWLVMLATVLVIAANMCLQGGEQVDVSRYVEPTASWLELKVTLQPATGMLVVYSPGYEEQQARFTDPVSSALIPFAEPILCVKAVGGPFEFNIEVLPVEGAE
jgi:hypothetical protein